MPILKCFIGFLAIFSIFSSSSAQKPPIDSTTFENWMIPFQAAISNNGIYMFYMVSDPALHQDNLYLRSIDAQWQKIFTGIEYPALTQDSRHALFQRKDTLFIVGLANDSLEQITGIEGTYALLPLANEDNLLVYKLKRNLKTLLARRISTGEQTSYSAVEKYWFNSTSQSLILLAKDSTGNASNYRLQKTLTGPSKAEDLWQGPRVENLVFSNDGQQFAFTTVNENSQQSLWHYSLTGQKAMKLLTDGSQTTGGDMKMVDILGISKGNEKIYLSLKSEKDSSYTPMPGVDIYSYKDPRLQSLQLNDLKDLSRRRFRAVVNISDGHFLFLEPEGEKVVLPNQAPLPDRYVLLVKTGPGDFASEWNWNKAAQSSMYLLSLDDGSKRLIYQNLHYGWASFPSFSLSPNEKYILFFDPKRSNYYSLDIAANTLKNITARVFTHWTQQNLEVMPAYKISPFGIGGFLDDGQSALVYDQYDIYKVDLTAKASPVNVTSSIGRKHHITLRLHRQLTPYNSNGKIILDAFNEETKDQGYYSLALNSMHEPDSLTMLPMKIPRPFIKSRDANAYLVFMENASTTPNFFYSTDLRTFIPVSNIHPERQFNWLTAELVTWLGPGGVKYQGILYKPENFDPKQKYPIIFVYYEQKSKDLHSFQGPPGLSNAEINTAFFVSNGYLVFTPDIHYTIGWPGRSAFNAVVSAADLLSKRPYVDKTKMGLQGHSFGGFETNYIIAHTLRFAAAMSFSGMTDFISAYGSIPDGASRQKQYEIARDRIGATLWQKPELYIENSPIFRANCVQTPLLMVANQDDNNVPHQQGIELFTALRRLEKKVWMLKYDGEGHGVSEDAAKDFSIRVFQFFNYYLKNAPPPKWMTVGIPAKLKGFHKGFELDTSGAIP